MLQFDSTIDLVLYIIQIIGCVSFATSGAITAIRKKADILGTLLLTMIEVFGGGLLRDLIMGRVPHICYDPSYLLLALFALVIASFWFLIAYFDKTSQFIEKHRHDFWIYLLDAIGIAVFCVGGMRVASTAIPEGAGTAGTIVFLVFLGVISGVGGGMFRDVFIGELPMVFRKHFYMTPCIIGCLVYSVFYLISGATLYAAIISILIIVVLRIFATIFRWNLPTAKGYNSRVLEAEKKFQRKESDDISQDKQN